MKNKEYSQKYMNGVKKYIKLYKVILPCLFSLLVICGMFVSVLIPLRPKYSESEKRELAKFPSFSVSTLLDGSYFKSIDTWFSDTFPFREKMIEANNNLKELSGFGDRIYGLNDNIAETIPDSEKDSSETSSEPETETETETEPDVPDQLGEVTQTLDNIVVIGDSGYEYCSFNQGVADKYISVLNKTASSLSGKSKVYSMLIPTSIDITMSDNVRKGINTTNQSEVMDYIFGSFSDDVNKVNIYKTMRMHRDEYIYFRTDHHWTALGAYYAYCDYAVSAGFTPRGLDKFTKESYGDFLGSFYRDTMNSRMKNNPDELIAYLPNYKTTLTYTTSGGQKIEWKLVNDVTNYPLTQKYSAFSAGDNPFTVIENTGKEKGKTCLVIKDSFGNAIIPFIAGHYKKVYVIDYRYYKEGFISFAKEKGINDILFCNNMSSVRSDTLISRMQAIAY